MEKLNKRIQKWLLNTNSKLNLSYLRLKSWPTILNVYLDKIVELDCACNQLTALPALPKCTKLYCACNQLTALPALPKCTKLYCYGNQLTALPALPQCIYLWCSNNRLTTLPALPKCTHLDCYNNKLRALPALPKCTWLACSWNQLTLLPALPECTNLICSNNRLTALPALPRCANLGCSHNRLFSDDIVRWRKVWRWQIVRQLIRFRTRLFRIIRILRLRLYLPRKNELHTELQYSPDHPGKFYLDERKSNQWCNEVVPVGDLKNTPKYSATLVIINQL